MSCLLPFRALRQSETTTQVLPHIISILTCQTKALTKDRQLPEATTGLFTKIHFSLI